MLTTPEISSERDLSSLKPNNHKYPNKVDNQPYYDEMTDEQKTARLEDLKNVVYDQENQKNGTLDAFDACLAVGYSRE